MGTKLILLDSLLQEIKMRLAMLFFLLALIFSPLVRSKTYLVEVEEGAKTSANRMMTDYDNEAEEPVLEDMSDEFVLEDLPARDEYDYVTSNYYGIDILTKVKRE